MTYVPRSDALSWGRQARAPQFVASPRFRGDLPALVAAHPGGSVLPVGLRRSYGDSVLNSKGGLIAMAGLDRFLDLDLATRTLRAEAGVTLGDIMRLVVPHGYFVPVTPGTRFVTLGGAIANDVHGKNHHSAGTFGRHVIRLCLIRGDGAEVEVSPQGNSDLYAATIGGLGLTGIIAWAEIRLQPIESTQLTVEVIPYGSLAEFWQLAAASADSHEHTVAWFDCTAKGKGLGRGIFSRANWSEDGRLVAHENRQRIGVPFEAPGGLFNSSTIRTFNGVYYAAQKRRAGTRREHYTRALHPLDGIAHWNRLYGRSGFWQYQCVCPPRNMRDAVPALLQEIAASGEGSLLAVLKTFGGIASPGMLSFPQEGATIALDFANRGERTLRLFARLDAIVREANGRLYAAKDGRIPRDMWRSGYPELERFMRHVDPAFGSDFWARVCP